MYKIDFISIFPELIQNWFQRGVIARAADGELFELNYWNLRNYSTNKHQRIDDRPFGGGPGMVIAYPPLAACDAAIVAKYNYRPFNVYLSPQGAIFNQHFARQLLEKKHIALWCGRYEGIDQRFIDNHIDLELSIGDFVLSGGEMAAAIIADAILRLIDGVLGDSQSAQQDSFSENLLDHPHYTRPEKTGTIRAPEILLSGNHARIARWRMSCALGKTFLQRPDIIEKLNLSDEQIELLNQYLATQQNIGEPS